MSGRALRRTAALAAWLCAGAPAAAAHEAQPPPASEIRDDGAVRLLYELPPAGSYELPPISRVTEHHLLDVAGARAPLLDLAPGQCAVLAFVYLSCADAAGCPLSLATLHRFDRAVARRDELRDRVRLVTVSFDPARDRPEQMAKLRHHLAPKGDWRFFTAAGPGDLAPVLEDYGQDVLPLIDAHGDAVGPLRHVTKVFLVDAERRVRNIYSTGFLDHRILLRDVETLLLEPAAAPR